MNTNSKPSETVLSGLLARWRSRRRFFGLLDTSIYDLSDLGLSGAIPKPAERKRDRTE
jgi:hypothetical protein